jgi:3-methyladenine DNA glycosylase/8-oxoguanine DNA glycosylase
MVLTTHSELTKASKHLAASDSVLAPIIKRAGLAQLEPHTDYYGALVNSIIGQQLSVKAAAAIKLKLITSVTWPNILLMVECTSEILPSNQTKRLSLPLQTSKALASGLFICF